MIKTNRVTDAFKKDLKELINSHSIESAVDIPDYVLAEHLCGYIELMSHTLDQRDKWFSVDMWSDDKRLTDSGKNQLSLFDDR